VFPTCGRVIDINEEEEGMKEREDSEEEFQRK
jgi:hypothetical protein